MRPTRTVDVDVDAHEPIASQIADTGAPTAACGAWASHSARESPVAHSTTATRSHSTCPLHCASLSSVQATGGDPTGPSSAQLRAAASFSHVQFAHRNCDTLAVGVILVRLVLSRCRVTIYGLGGGAGAAALRGG